MAEEKKLKDREEILALTEDTRKAVAVIHDHADGVRDLAKQFGDLKRAHEAASAVVKALGDRWDECERQLVAAMVEEQTPSIRIDGYGLFSLVRSAFPSVTAANKPQFFEYLKGSGNAGLLRLDVPTNTLTAFLKEHKKELAKQFQTSGVTAFQAHLLTCYRDSEGGNPYGDAAKSVNQPVDEMAAEELADALLRSQGAAIFSKASVSLKK